MNSFFKALTFSISLVAIIGYLCFSADIPVKFFTRDPIALLNGHPLMGALSNLGIVIWSGTAAICLFTSSLIQHRDNTGVTRFLRRSGLATAYLMLDDLFMLHEGLIPEFFSIPQPLVYGIYGLFFLIFLFVSRTEILNSPWPLLVTSIALLGLSVTVDLTLNQQGLHLLIEDGLKFLGITSWSVYFATTCSIQIKTNSCKPGGMG